MAAPTSRTLLELEQDVLSRLSENADSVVASLPGGADGTVTEDTSAAVRRYLNEGARKLARAAYPIQATGTLSGASGKSYFSLNLFDCTDGSGLWAVRKLVIGSTTAKRASRSWMDINTASTAVAWAPDGSAGIVITPALSATTTLTATGFAVPPAISEDADTFAWLEPDLDYLLVDYALGEICAKVAAQDEVLGALAPVWMARFNEGLAMQSMRLKQTDTALWAAHFAYPLGTGK